MMLMRPVGSSDGSDAQAEYCAQEPVVKQYVKQGRRRCRSVPGLHPGAPGHQQVWQVRAVQVSAEPLQVLKAWMSQ